MKLKLHMPAIVALVPAALLGVTGCSTEPKGTATTIETSQSQEGNAQSSTKVTVRRGEPGGAVVKTYQETATVVTVDRAARKITLQDPYGEKNTVKCGPEVANFDQIQPGDRVKARVTEQLVVFVRDSSEMPQTGQATTVALAPLGAKPSVVLADTVETTAKVTALDLPGHKATLQFPNGQYKTFQVREDVDLSKRRVGEEVVIRSTEALAISVEKP